MNRHWANESPVVSQAELGRTHFIGVGGEGMSGIARLLAARGVPVSGSDMKDSEVISGLRAGGVTVFIGHDPSHLDDVQTVVFSTAIRAENPELAAANKRGLRLLHRSQALAAAMGEDAVAAIAGTHGKTTTTAMTVLALRGAGFDPSFAIGAEAVDLGTNAASGKSPLFVAEADESDASFHNYRPRVAVVTNIEEDHLDYHGTLAAIQKSFEEFAERIVPGGLLVACADDPGSTALADWAEAAGIRVLRYGRSATAQLRLFGPLDELSIEFADEPGVQHALRLAVPGEHNALNAMAALAAARELGAEVSAALAEMSRFQGAARRFQLQGESGGVRLYDDYAHHPTEIKAAIAAGRSVAGQGRVLALFQPKRFTRVRDFAPGFAQALRAADLALVIELYPAGEDPIAGVSSALIADAPRRSGDPEGVLVLTPQPAEAIARLAAEARPGDVVMTIGSGAEVEHWGPPILQSIRELRAGAAGTSTTA